MKKKDLFKNITITKRGTTIFMNNNHISFSYTPANDIVKDEFKDKYRYFGGLQSNYHEDNEDHKNIEKWLCELAEIINKYLD